MTCPQKHYLRDLLTQCTWLRNPSFCRTYLIPQMLPSPPPPPPPLPSSIPSPPPATSAPLLTPIRPVELALSSLRNHVNFYYQNLFIVKFKFFIVYQSPLTHIFSHCISPVMYSITENHHIGAIKRTRYSYKTHRYMG